MGNFSGVYYCVIGIWIMCVSVRAAFWPWSKWYFVPLALIVSSVFILRGLVTLGVL